MTIGGLARLASRTRPAEWLVKALESVDQGDARFLAVLTYHRVVSASSVSAYPGHCVEPDDFAAQMHAVVERYTVVDLEMVLAAREGYGRLPQRSVLLTFDDAYRDFEQFAWPIIREIGLPVTLFVPTDYPGSRRWFWWDRLYEVLSAARLGQQLDTPVGALRIEDEAARIRAYRRLRDYCKRADGQAAAVTEQLAHLVDAGPPTSSVLDWDALRRLRAEGVRVAPHSRSHRLLPTLAQAELDEELRGARHDLVRELGTAPPCFAYPAGVYDERVRTAAAGAGYRVAFTTRRGVNDLRGADWLALRRINVGPSTNGTLLRAQLGRWASLLP